MKRIKAYVIDLIRDRRNKTRNCLAKWNLTQTKNYFDFGPVYHKTLEYQLIEVKIAWNELWLAMYTALIYNHVD